jgi:flagellar biosynthesis/type III secretory pathway protein FliH
MRNAVQFLQELTNRQLRKADQMNKGVISRNDIVQELLTEEYEEAFGKGTINGLRQASQIAEMHQKYDLMQTLADEATNLEQSNGSTPTGS